MHSPCVCVCIFAIAYRMPDVHTQSNAYFMHFAIEWKYEITHSVRIDNWNRVIYNQTLFAFTYLYFSVSERQTERKKASLSLNEPIEFCASARSPKSTDR